MTLFKDDYHLLERYLKYYSDLGVNLFYIYYNQKITKELIKNIIKINKTNICLYIVEWDHQYWHAPTQHNAQTMAMNNSLHILKNYGNYTLYNDLDEYIILDNYQNFNEMIDNNNNIDIFIFKNRFCKLGLDLIGYEDFNKKFDLTKIIKGNYWDKYREKNLIKLQNINILGVHKIFEPKILSSKVISEFYHIINFEEKYREELMTEYIM